MTDHALASLAATLADWSEGTTFTIYLFGSRVRGDHRPDSDVDVVMPIPNPPTKYDGEWWVANNEDHFLSINERLLGQLRITEANSRLARAVVKAAENPAYKHRNVLCVFLSPKP